jgi:hypothetical protein
VDTIPETLAQITPAWLSLALSRQGTPLEVSSVRLEDAHSGTTGRGLIGVEYRGTATGPERLFVKLPPEDDTQRAFVAETGMGTREARFYRELAAEVPVRVPRCYFADFDSSDDRYLMLLEHLPDSGCTFRNASTRYSIDYMKSVLALFARLHAAYWDSPRFTSDLAWVTAPARHEMGPRLVRRALERYREEMPPAFGRLGDLYVEATAGVHDVWERGTHTLVHGDCHDGNLFYDTASDEPGLLDWAIVSRSSGMRDVAYFLAGTPRPEDRGRIRGELLGFYLDQLAELGVPSLDRAALESEFTWHTAYVWIAAVTTLAMGSQWQPENYVRKTMGRLNEAIADYDCAGALTRAL